jgi:hypothetical protein
VPDTQTIETTIAVEKPARGSRREAAAPTAEPEQKPTDQDPFLAAMFGSLTEAPPKPKQKGRKKDASPQEGDQQAS